MPEFTLEALAGTIAERAASGDSSSYTASLLRKGVARCAQKLGEEAVETTIAAVTGDRAGLRSEAADLLYHLLVLLQASGVSFDEVKAELAERTGTSGLEEKAAPGRRRMMDQIARPSLSPYRVYPIEDWAKLRADTPMTLSAEEVVALKSLGDPISLPEVEQVYLPLSRLLSFYVAAAQELFDVTRRFLGTDGGKTPFIIGIAGSVAVGKSTTARILQELLGRWPSRPRVALVTTDGFLFPNAVLEQEGLMGRKGFPESYDVAALLAFLSDIKAGRPRVSVPVYSHLSYDVVPGEYAVVDRPEILILEGLNVLQTSPLPRDGKAVPFVSDFFDFSIYIDADESAVRRWYLDRFMRLKETRFRDPLSYFHKYADVSEAEAIAIATGLWEGINLVNLRDNILPTRPRADLILRKGENHSVEEVSLRRI